MIVSVALIEIFFSLTPDAAQSPSNVSEFGRAVYLIGLSGKSTLHPDKTDSYFLGWSSGFTTINLLAVKIPEGESSLLEIIVEPSKLASLPTNNVVHAIIIYLLKCDILF